jgi:hypothetical protein
MWTGRAFLSGALANGGIAMNDCSDLEISLRTWLGNTYEVELRLTQPGDKADIRLVRNGPALARFDLEQLTAQRADPPAYGRLLTEQLFSDPEVLRGFVAARNGAQALSAQLRVRLFVASNAFELQRLRWETLRDPQDANRRLLVDEQILFSRYLTSVDWRPVKPRPPGDLRALVAVANPEDIERFAPSGRPLVRLDVAKQVEQARSALQTIQVTSLGGGGSLTLNNLTAHLRDGYDVLYLVAHGALIQNEQGEAEPWLWLEDQHGMALEVAGAELVARLSELPVRPTLVVLASCQSGGADDVASGADALTALGPRLAEAGIPAVIAMQGDVTVETTTTFMAEFFRELSRDGQIDRAMAVARAAVGDRADFWSPVLFMRLRDGRVWSEMGSLGERPGFEKWPTLMRTLRDGKCTPILGPGLVERLFGSPPNIAHRWAERYHVPMAPRDLDDLTQVAQYLAIDQDRNYLVTERDEYLRIEVLRRFGDELPPSARRCSLDELLAQTRPLLAKQESPDPHRMLADLRLPLYLTSNTDDLLEQALTEAGRPPIVDLCRWYEEVQSLERPAETKPSVDRPLVYHLLGMREEEQSLVLTQDDYFRFLIRVSEDPELIPAIVRAAMRNTALLFLGFNMDDWTFRLLFRSILRQPGGLSEGFTHIAVQLDPEAGRILDPERARRHLQEYFEKARAGMSIYWDSLDDFTRELRTRCAADPFMQLVAA